MENLKINLIGLTEKQKQSAVSDLESLGFVAGFKSIVFYTYLYACIGESSYGNTIQFGNSANTFAKNKGKELTLPQLRDLVVLHRNDVNDATHTHKNFEKAKSIILSATNEVCDWIDDKWKVTCRQVSELKPIQPQPEQGLISGADALRALAENKNVQCSIAGKNDWTVDILTITPYYFIGMGSGQFQFRLKPRTVKIELEIPAPFEPKEGDMYWHISPEYMSGYANSMYNDGNVDTWQQFGAWRTEEEIKQVVAALRGIKG